MQIGINGTTVIGSNVSLFCNVNQYPWPANSTSFMWSNQEGPIVDGDRLNITLLNATYSYSQPNFISSLQFNPLTVNDGGMYLCRVTLNLTYPRDTVGIATNTTSIRLVVTGELKVHWAVCVLLFTVSIYYSGNFCIKFEKFYEMKLVHYELWQYLVSFLGLYSLVCVQYNSWKGKNGEKQGRPCNTYHMNGIRCLFLSIAVSDAKLGRGLTGKALEHLPHEWHQVAFFINSSRWRKVGQGPENETMSKFSYSALWLQLNISIWPVELLSCSTNTNYFSRDCWRSSGRQSVCSLLLCNCRRWPSYQQCSNQISKFFRVWNL